MQVGILSSGLMGGKLGTIFARAGREVSASDSRVPLRAVWEIGEPPILVPSTTEHESIKESPLWRGKRHRCWGGQGVAEDPPRLPARPQSLRQPPLPWSSKGVFHAARRHHIR